MSHFKPGLCLYFLVLLLVCVTHISSLENGLTRTPPMGWMAWERYRCITDCQKYPDECISENLFKRMADLMVSEGYLEAGYDYVNIDDCWSEKERDQTTQKLVADKSRFPNGIKALSDYIHSKGLKFGIYGDYGTYTCAGYPGTINHMELDAQTFAEWDVDFIKLDGCYADVENMVDGYIEFGKYLNETKRPMVYSCSWPAYQEYSGIMPSYETLQKTCNIWRNWGDIDDSWSSVKSITNFFSGNQSRIQPYAAPGSYNDPDTLLLGNYGLSYDQSKAQMALWTVLAAPLLMSNDLGNITPEIKAILLNKDIIKVDQDPLGIQGLHLKSIDNIHIWSRPITPVINKEYSYAVAFVSYRTDGAPHAIQVNLSDLKLNSINGYIMQDLFADSSDEVYINTKKKIEVRVNPTGVQFYKFTPI